MPGKPKVQKSTTIQEWSSYKRTRERAAAVLDVLWSMHDHELRSRGRATDELFKKMPVNTITGTKGRLMDIRSFGMFLGLMAESRFITRDINGKRTNRIAIDTLPSDWRPPVQDKTDSNGQQEMSPVLEEEAKKPEDTEPAVESDDDSALAELFGGRPGRFAARIERSIPALVEEGVVAGINGWIAQIITSMGYNTGVQADTLAVDDLSGRLIEAQAELQKMSDDLRIERRDGHAAREELNRILRLQYSTRDTTDVRASELPEAWRALGNHAIKSGWTLHRTGGGHIMWRSPTGFRYFSSSTSSDYRSVRNARADMEKEGLPKEQ